MTLLKVRQITKIAKRNTKLVTIKNGEKLVIFEKKDVTLHLGKIPNYSFNEEGA